MFKDYQAMPDRRAEADGVEFLYRKVVQKEGILLNPKKIIEELGTFIQEHTDLSIDEKEVVRDYVEMAIYAAARAKPANQDAVREERAPVRELLDHEIDKIKEIAKNNRWEDRGDDKRSPVQWVADNYEKFVPGLLQSHILQADPKLYQAFVKHVGRKGLPEGLDIPTLAENNFRKAPVEERTNLKMRRKLQAAGMRVYPPKRASVGD